VIRQSDNFPHFLQAPLFKNFPKMPLLHFQLTTPSQLLEHRNDLAFKLLRGNVDTRVRKLDNGEYDAIVLAAAGLTRLHLSHRISEYFSKEIMLPAIGQGALCIESRVQDESIKPFFKHHCSLR